MEMATKKNRTIYDYRTAVEKAVRDAAPLLYNALKDLLDEVESRQGMREDIASVVLSQAHAAINAAAPFARAALKQD